MINHARTLLLNVQPKKNQRQDAGYEYIPETFRPLVFPMALATVYKVLFGIKPDMYFLNLRARELLTYIHQTELVEYARRLDPRVTYETTTDAVFFENATPSITVVQTAGLPLPISWGGTFAASAATGVTTKQFEVIVNKTAAIYSATIRELYNTTESETITISDPARPPTIKLPETNLQFKLDLQDQDTASFLQAGGTARWSITARANPAPAITTLLPILEILGEPLFLELFGVAAVEPYATFKNLWFDHPLPAYRLAGLVLAFIYRAEELRKVNNG